MSSSRVNPSLPKIKNQKGQITVFVALSFLILFTMFAMTVNVAMVVHDKINLQNAVDFASIYVAQRQAEQLNAIAHFNYQIRQAHKLLAYRHIVVGTAGIRKDTPANRTSPDDTEQKYYLADKSKYPLCVGTELLFQDITADQWCQEKWYAGGFSGIPILNVVNNYLGSNSALKSTTIKLGNQIKAEALLANLYSWWFTNVIFASYRQQVAYRKGLIKGLAANLSKPITASGMKDLYGQSVYEGAYKTFLFNLSESNKAVTSSYNFKVTNSLEGIDIKQWLPEIKTIIAPNYADRETIGGGNGSVGNIQWRWFYEMPMSMSQANSQHNAFIERVDPDKFLRSFTGAGMPLDHDLEEILGFEKNPWYMVYNQITAQTVSNALFNLTPGTPINAQAFAKPFGGRIGPWYGKRWSAGSNASSGPKTVEIWSPRKTGGGGAPGGSDPTVLPNAPKYPGDQLGWHSRAAMSSTGQIGAPAKLHEKFYNMLVQNLYPDGSGDAIANDVTTRAKELNALAPDIFDIYYYSVDSNFHQNYLEGKLDTWLMNEAQYNFIKHSNPKIWRDLGYIQSSQQDFTVQKQLTESTRKNLGPQSFFALESGNERGRALLLTSWVPGDDVMDYRSPASGPVAGRFGKCKKFYGSQKYNVPGECLEGGGRVGYSVKIVSKDYLRASDHNMGGDSGSIANPPK